MKLDRQRLSVASHRLQLPGFCSTCAALVLLVLSGIAMAETAPTLRTDSSWFVDMNRFAASAHSGFKCEDCHGTMLEEGHKHPNPDDPAFLKTPAVAAYDYSRCQKCHQVSYDRYMTGGHALARTAAADDAAVIPTVWPPPVYAAPTCGACHASHYAPSGLSRVESGHAWSIPAVSAIRHTPPVIWRISTEGWPLTSRMTPPRSVPTVMARIPWRR
jgi:hypothetical protein